MKITAGMRKVTPSGYAEEAYQAARPGKIYPGKRGTAGIDIPDPRTTFRSTIDPKLLTAIVRAANHAMKDELLTPERETATGAGLAEALRKAFPPAHMDILAIHKVAHRQARALVDMGAMYRAQSVLLPETLLLPAGGHLFRTGPGRVGLDVPEALLPFFDDVARVQDAERELDRIRMMPTQFKANEGRWPLWREIEEAWPRIGAWMAAQRAGG